MILGRFWLKHFRQTLFFILYHKIKWKIKNMIIKLHISRKKKLCIDYYLRICLELKKLVMYKHNPINMNDQQNLCTYNSDFLPNNVNKNLLVTIAIK